MRLSQRSILVAPEVNNSENNQTLGFTYLREVEQPYQGEDESVEHEDTGHRGILLVKGQASMPQKAGPNTARLLLLRLLVARGVYRPREGLQRSGGHIQVSTISGCVVGPNQKGNPLTLRTNTEGSLNDAINYAEYHVLSKYAFIDVTGVNRLIERMIGGLLKVKKGQRNQNAIERQANMMGTAHKETIPHVCRILPYNPQKRRRDSTHPNG